MINIEITSKEGQIIDDGNSCLKGFIAALAVLVTRASQSRQRGKSESSPEYVPESDLEAHPEDDDDEDPKEDLVDYPADGGDDGDDEEGSLEDDEDDDMDIEADKEEEEEHPAPADSVVVASTAADQAPSAKETEPFETDESAATPPPHPAYRMSARISIPSPTDLEIVRLLAMPSPTASPLSHWSSPPPQIPFPPLPPILSLLSPVLSPAPPPSPIRSLGYRAAMIRLRAEAASTSLPPLQLPSASRREDRPEVTLPPQKRLGIALGPRYELLAGRLNMLFRDRRAHAYTRHLMETEARMSQEAWVRATDASDLVHGEVMSLRTTVLGTGYRITGTAGTHWRSYIATVLSQLKQMAPKRTTRSTADQETINATSITNAQLQAMIDQGVTAALAARDALRSTNGDDSHNSGTSVRRTERATRECTYIDFLKCQPLPFKGTEGVSSLSQWFERMESVFHISNCAVKNQVKFATCTLYSVALTWWNTHVKTELALLCGRMFSEESDKIEKYIGGLPDMIHGSVVASKPKTMQEAIEIATELMDKKIHTFAEQEIASKRKFENTSRNTQNQQQLSNKRQNTGRVYTVASGKKKQYEGSKPLCAKCNYYHDGPCALKCRNCNKIGHFACDCRSATNTNNANNQRGTGLGLKTKQMAPKRTTRSTADQETINATSITNAQLQAMIDQGVTAALAARDALKSTNEDDSHISGTGVRRKERATRECLPDMIHGSVVASKPKTVQEAVEIATELMDKKIRTFAEREIASKRKNTANANNANNQRGTGLGHKTTCYECGVQGHFKRECPKLKNNNNNGNQGGRNNAPARVYAVGRAGTDPYANVVTVIAYAEKIVRIPWGNETLIIHGDGSNQGNATRLSIISCTKTEKYVMKGFPIFLAHITTKEI
uniref:CCHC-type domain-containing protein n=2 Tax=Tanacetum cinerariifolium TaxID=118510 RepID=A0A6L2MKS2_TANCI|nr:hypothetical protein [Tanacetum cinerariifolium]